MQPETGLGKLVRLFCLKLRNPGPPRRQGPRFCLDPPADAIVGLCCRNFHCVSHYLSLQVIVCLSFQLFTTGGHHVRCVWGSGDVHPHPDYSGELSSRRNIRPNLMLYQNRPSPRNSTESKN